MTETTSSASTVVFISSSSSAVTNPVKVNVELDPRRHTDGPSPVVTTAVVSKNLLSAAQPSTVLVPCSSSSVLSNVSQYTTPTLTTLVAKPAASGYQPPSLTEPKSTGSVVYRPAAALALNIGRNLVTGYVFQQIIGHEAKWKGALDTEKVPVMCLVAVNLSGIDQKKLKFCHV